MKGLRRQVLDQEVHPVKNEGTDLIDEGITTAAKAALVVDVSSTEGTDLIDEGITTRQTGFFRTCGVPSREGTDLIDEGITTPQAGRQTRP